MKPINRRDFFSINADLGCACAFFPQATQNDPNRGTIGPVGAAELYPLGSKFRITGIKTFGVTLPTPEQADRPYVFVKIETNQGVYGWGEGTLEGKAAATLSCIEDFKEFLIGADPMPVEHHWQSMYVHSFYRAGPVIGSAIAAIDQALWDIRGKVLNQPVYKLLGVEGLTTDSFPNENKLVDSRLAYWIRPGKHAMGPPDWETYLTYADKWLK